MSYALISALCCLILSSWCPWDIGLTAGDRIGLQTQIFQTPKPKLIV